MDGEARMDKTGTPIIPWAIGKAPGATAAAAQTPADWALALPAAAALGHATETATIVTVVPVPAAAAATAAQVPAAAS